MDDVIAASRFSQLADAILAAGLKLYYYAMAKPVKQFDYSVLSKMHQSGCRYLMWGVESGSQRVLDLMDKGIRIPEVDAVLNDTRKAGVRNHVFVMGGFPTETRGNSRPRWNSWPGTRSRSRRCIAASST